MDGRRWQTIAFAIRMHMDVLAAFVIVVIVVIVMYRRVVAYHQRRHGRAPSARWMPCGAQFHCINEADDEISRALACARSHRAFDE